MKANALIALFLVATTAVVATERVRFAPAATSTLTINGTSTLHPWSVASSTIEGAIDIAPEIAANPVDASSWSSEKPALVTVRIPVNAIKAEHDRMTRIMLEALKAKNFPEVQYEMIKATLEPSTGDAFVIKTNGKLTIAGVTRDMEMNVSATRNADQGYVLTGSAPIKMTDYGITPPVTMLGALKTGDQVTVTFRWVVNRVQ